MTETGIEILQVVDLIKRYGSVQALNGISLSVTRGEVFGVVGPNGAGKTTLLECILGLRQACSGRIVFQGVDIQADRTRAVERMGALLQSATLQDKITPREAVSLFASFYASKPDVSELLQRFGLEDKARARFSSLSGGQQQRLFLALAFVNDPDLVVLDEPTAGLDPVARRNLRGLIRQQRGKDRTVLLSTHDLNEAEELCDRIGILHGGRFVAVDTPLELFKRSGVLTAVCFRTDGEFASDSAVGIPGVVRTNFRDGVWELETADPDKVVKNVAALMEATGGKFLELHIRRAKFDDVYFSLTGSVWRPDSTADGGNANE